MAVYIFTKVTRTTHIVCVHCQQRIKYGQRMATDTDEVAKTLRCYHEYCWDVVSTRDAS